MTKDEGLKLAIGKIKSARDCHFAAIDPLLLEAEEILEQALAAPVQPVAWVFRRGLIQKFRWNRDKPVGQEAMLYWEPLYTTPPAAAVQEPVAWIEHHKGGDNLEWDNPGGKCTALYTTPPAQPAPVQEQIESAKQIWREDQQRIAELSAEIDRLTAAQRQWVEVEQVKWDGEKFIAKLKEKNT